VKISLHIKRLQKAAAFIALLLSFSCAFNFSYGNPFVTKGEDSKIASLSAERSGESIVLVTPAVPAAACCEKNRYQSPQSFSSRVMGQSSIYKVSEESFFTSFINQLTPSAQFSMRLHLAYRVLLI